MNVRLVVMKKILSISILSCAAMLSFAAATPVILDTDIGSSTDDVLALELACRYHRAGQVDLLGVMIDRPGACNVRFTEAYLNYHDLNGIPVGTIEGSSEGQLIFTPYPQLDFPPPTTRAGKVANAVELYRALLAQAADHSVDICAIGFFTNLMRLLDSKPDSTSPLSGYDLVARKVRFLRIMAGSFNGALDHPEYNVWGDIPSARRIFSSWPTRIVCSPYEVGVKIYYPNTEVVADFPPSHPVNRIYRQWKIDGDCPKSQLMWDPMTVLGVLNDEAKLGYFAASPRGTVTVDEKGFTTFLADEKGRTTIQEISMEKCFAIRHYLRKLISGQDRSLVSESSTLRLAAVCAAPAAGGVEFVVLTNLSKTATLDLSGMRVVCSEPEKGPTMDVTFPSGRLLPPCGTLRLTQPVDWPTTNINDTAVNFLIYSKAGDVLQETYFDSRWWKGATLGTGAWLEPVEQGALVLEQAQWRICGK